MCIWDELVANVQAVPVKISLQVILVKSCLVLVGFALSRSVGASAGASFYQ